MKTLFLVRHGQTDWNIQGRFQGRRDTPLNRTGIRQAKCASDALSGIHVDTIWSSPLSRAVQTAQIIAEPHGLTVTLHENLTEICHGAWEGLESETVASQWPELLNEWHANPQNVKMPGGESLNDVRCRSIHSITDIILGTSGTAIVIAHDAVLKVLLCHFLGAPLSSFWRFRLENGSISVFDLSCEVPVLCEYGSTGQIGGSYGRSIQRGL